MTEERKKLNQQDLVDNTINNMIETLNPSDNILNWNGTIINEIRIILEEYFVEQLHLYKENEFYPYIEEEEEEDEDEE